MFYIKKDIKVCRNRTNFLPTHLRAMGVMISNKYYNKISLMVLGGIHTYMVWFIIGMHL